MQGLWLLIGMLLIPGVQANNNTNVFTGIEDVQILGTFTDRNVCIKAADGAVEIARKGPQLFIFSCIYMSDQEETEVSYVQ